MSGLPTPAEVRQHQFAELARRRPGVFASGSITSARYSRFQQVHLPRGSRRPRPRPARSRSCRSGRRRARPTPPRSARGSPGCCRPARPRPPAPAPATAGEVDPLLRRRARRGAGRRSGVAKTTVACVFEQEPQPGGAGHAAAGDDRAARPRPRPRTRSRTRGTARTRTGRTAGRAGVSPMNGKLTRQQSEQPLPRLGRVEPAQRVAGAGAGRLVQPAVALDREGEGRAVGRVAAWSAASSALVVNGSAGEVGGRAKVGGGERRRACGRRTAFAGSTTRSAPARAGELPVAEFVNRGRGEHRESSE